MDPKNLKDQELNSWLLMCVKGEKPKTKIEIDAAWCIEQGADINTRDGNGRTPLHIAAKELNSTLVEKFLQHGADVNALDKNGDTPICIAARSLEIIQDYDTNANATNDSNNSALQLTQCDRECITNINYTEGNTPLHIAVIRKEHPILELLLKFGADPNIVDKFKITLLHETINTKNEFLVEQLLKHGANVNKICEVAFVAPLHLAVLKQEARIVDMLLNLDADVNIKNKCGWTPLHYAVIHGDVEITERLLQFGADVNLADKNGWTPLHAAVYYKKALLTEILCLKFNADINITDNYGYTPLHRAAIKADKFIINLLLKFGAKTNVKNKKGNTPLHLVAHRSPDVIGLLLKFGSDVDAKNNAGDTALCRAARHATVSTVEKLLKFGADVDINSGFGNTVLHEAVIYNNTEVVELFLRRGFNVNSTNIFSNQPMSSGMYLEQTPRLMSPPNETNVNNETGNTPLHLAAFHGWTVIVDLLLRFGADINAKNGVGNTALHIAARCNHADIVDMLLRRGADKTLRNKDCDTALTVVRVYNYMGYEKVLTLLENADTLCPRENLSDMLENISQSERKVGRNDLSMKSKPEFKYSKKTGTSGVSGQLYETKLLSLVLIRALNENKIEHFFLGSNISEIGDLDDVCMRYKLRGKQKPVVLFVQAKHREKGSLTDADLWSPSGDFSLRKYFESYLMIKDRFRANHEDPMFEGNFDDVECNLVIYTPAKNCIEKKTTERQVSEKVDYLINTGQTTDIFQYNYDEEYVESLTELTVVKRLEKFGMAFLELIMSLNMKPDAILVNKQIARYHVVVGREVLQLCQDQPTSKDYRLWHFRSVFFESDCRYLIALKNIFIKELASKRVDQSKITNEDIQNLKQLIEDPCASTLSKSIGKFITYNDKMKELQLVDVSSLKKKIKNTELDVILKRLSNIVVDDNVVIESVRIKLNELKIKLPLAFGNLDMMFRGSETKVQKRVRAVADKIIDLLKMNEDTKIIVISNDIVGPGKLIQQGIIDINGGIGSAVGNLIVFDDNTKMLKFDVKNESLPKYAALFLKELQDDRYKPYNRELSSYRIKVDIEEFPKYSFNGDEYDMKLARDYLQNLWFYTNQARENTVEHILKNHINKYYNSKEQKNMFVFEMHSTAIFLQSHDEIQKWWLQKGETFYLTQNNDIFDRAKQTCVDNILLTVINYMCYLDISEIDFKWNQRVPRNDTNVLLQKISNETLGKMFEIYDMESKSLKINIENKNKIIKLLQTIKQLANKKDLPDMDIKETVCDIFKQCKGDVTGDLQNDAESKFKFLKRGGTSGISGQLYVTKLLCLVFMRALNKTEIENFLFGSNICDIGDINDICLRYQVAGQSKNHMLFIRTKHRENRDKGKLTIEDLRSVSGDFSVRKYFESFFMIQDRFQINNKDPMFEGDFTDIECSFVIYTPIKGYFDTKKNQRQVNKNVDFLINTGQITDVYQSDYDNDYIDCLSELRVLEELKNTATVFIEFIMSENISPDVILMKKPIARYHVVIGRKVLRPCKDQQESNEYRLWQFRSEFFESKCKYCIALKNIFVKELLSKCNKESAITDEDTQNFKQLLQDPCALIISKILGKLITFNDDTKKLQLENISALKNVIKNNDLDALLRKLSEIDVDENIINKAIQIKLSALKIKLPLQFGNIDMMFDTTEAKVEERVKATADMLVHLFEINKDTKIIDIGDEFLQSKIPVKQIILDINRSIGSAVGNLLILDENTKMLKLDLTNQSLPNHAALLLKELKHDRYKPINEELDSYRIKNNIEGFPKYCFDGDECDKKQAINFLNNLWFYTNQAKENEVENILKDEMKYHDTEIDNGKLSSRNVSDPVFLTSHDTMLKWWMQVGESPYLTRASEIFEQAELADIDNLLLTVINYMYVSKIYSIDINIKQNTTDYIKFMQMHQTFKKISSRLFCIFDPEFDKVINIEMPAKFEEAETNMYFTELVFSLEIHPDMEWVALKISALSRRPTEYFLVAKAGPGRRQTRARDGFLLLQQFGNGESVHYIEGAVDPGLKRHFPKSKCRW